MPVYKGWNAVIKKNGSAVGKATEVRLIIDNALEYYYPVGSRKSARIYEGPIAVEGTISRAFIDTSFLSLVADEDTLSEFDLSFKVGSVSVYAWGCKLTRGSIAIPQDGIITEDMDFKAASVSFATS